AVLQGEQRLDVEEPADEGLRLADAAVFLQILQGIDDEIDPNRGNAPAQLGQDLFLTFSFLSSLRGGKYHETQSQRYGAGIDHFDIPVLKLARRQGCGLV